MDSLTNLFNILKVALGLGFVIFLHELGHFVLAKWNGVKVEKFSIGFGPTVFGFRKGETEYVLAAVPLGGFVKMLGEGPDEESNKSSDPRAYPNKSVGARMAIISAGVIMNLILGLACFVYAYGQGMIEIPARIGAVKAGAPAYEAGIQAGDEIVSIDGRRDVSFLTARLKVSLSGPGQVLHFELKRPGREALIAMDIEPRREATAEAPTIGIAPSESLTLSGPIARPPAGLDRPAEEAGKGLKAGDRVVAVGPVGEPATPVTSIVDWYRLLARYMGKPLQVVAERDPPKEAGSPGKAAERVTATLPPNQFVDFGFRLKIEPVKAIRKGSPAEKAGFRSGDLIVKVDGRDDFDPMQLPSVCYEKAGQPMTFEVVRAEGTDKGKHVAITVTPDDSTPWTENPIANEPLDVPGLGLAYPVRTKIEAVAAGSPAEKAGLKVGDVINGITVPPTEPVKPPNLFWRVVKGLYARVFGQSAPKPDIVFDDDTPAWPSTFQALQFRPSRPVFLTVNNSSKTVELTPVPDLAWFHPLRGEQFEELREKIPPLAPMAALRRGFDDTIDNILSIYAMLRSLFQARVSPKSLGGPITIARVAYNAAGASLKDLVHFLGMLSINLAVLNFLPIPPLDGGQMIFLVAEKVRGRPLPESAQIAGTYLGLALVLGLMVFVLFQDVSRLVTG